MMTIKEKAVKRFNKVMMDIGYYHVTIGTEFSEMYNENTSISEMVKEAEFWLDTYYEEDHANGQMKEDDRKLWLSETGKLKRFISAFKGVEEEPAKEIEEPKAEEVKAEETKEEAPAEEKEEPKKDPNAPKTQKEKLLERIEKNETKLEKAKKLLAKKEAKAAKNDLDEYELGWLIEEIEAKKYQIEELEALIERQRKQLETSKDEISEKDKADYLKKILPPLPEVLSKLADLLEPRILEDLKDENERKRKAFQSTEEQLQREAKYHAGCLVESVWLKIFEKTGNLIKCENVRPVGYGLNGIFKGENGTVRVQTVFAGGYNIQCLHMRTLVHEI